MQVPKDVIMQPEEDEKLLKFSIKQSRAKINVDISIQSRSITSWI